MREENSGHMHTLVDDGEGEPALSLNQTAHVLDVTRRQVYYLLDDAELISKKVGTNRLVTVASITAYIERLRSKAAAQEERARAEGEQRAESLRGRADAYAERLRTVVEQDGAAA